MKTNSSKSIFLFFLAVIFFSNCKSQKKPITGFNVKWRALPEVQDKELIKNIKKLKPQLLRYPGGTVTHKWNWKTGKATPSQSSDYIHPIEDVSVLFEKTNTKILFVMDVVNSSVDDQIEMLHRVNIPIEYIELGNEIYSNGHPNYLIPFPNGKSYADTVNTWVPKLKQHFPKAKIAALLIGKHGSSPRQHNWNEKVTSNINVKIDAYTYHIYIGNGESFHDRKIRFEEKYKKRDKEVWVTEYGVKDQNLSKLLNLADYVESIADISLNHVLVSTNGNYSKLTSDGRSITKKGKEFIERVK